MTATVRAECVLCGTVEISTEEVALYHQALRAHGTVYFHCPTCQRLNKKDVGGSVLIELRLHRVKRQTWAYPEEIFERPINLPSLNDYLVDYFVSVVLENDHLFWGSLDRCERRSRGVM